MEDQTQAQTFVDESVDISECDREPIHLLGKVQSFGALIVLDDRWHVHAMSDNASSFLEINVEFGIDFSALLSREARHTLRGELHKNRITGAVERILSIALVDEGSAFSVSLHHNGEFILLEFEAVDEFSSRDDDFLRSMFLQTNKRLSFDELIDLYAFSLRSYTGFDRVMIYKFLPDGSGNVIAEAGGDHSESYLGLRFPASDIPKQARRLYLASTLRFIADVHDQGRDIMFKTQSGVSARGESRDPASEPPFDQPIDLSHAQLRSVSEVHIQYLKNMGVEASLSVSIIVGGELWGLVACHHNTPKLLPVSQRIQLNLFAQIIALEIAHRSALRDKENADAANAIYHSVLAKFDTSKPLQESLHAQLSQLRSSIECDGIALRMEGQIVSEGLVPESGLMAEIHQTMIRDGNVTVVTTNALREWLGGDHSPDAFKTASGMMAMAISREPNDFIYLFRQAEVEKVKWAGNPEKSVVKVDGQTRLMPRSSFDVWQQEHIDRSKPWSEREIRMAESMRIGLIESAIRHLRDQELIRQRSGEQKELLIRELNHRVRNILNLVNAVISQTHVEGRDINEFVHVLSRRIQALSSAHDQLTASVRKEIPIRLIIETELQAYQRVENAVSMSGCECTILAEAVTPVVLVIHELFTNCVKYGALSARESGALVRLRWERSEDNGLRIHWQEEGGPEVTHPDNDSFGMTIIKSVIPHELKGSAKIEFDPSGFRAELFIPSDFVNFNDEHNELDPQNEAQAADALNSTSGKPDQTAETKILIAEDSLLIALDLKKKFKSMQYGRVEIAGTVDQGLRLIETFRPDFAVLDINLGIETSFPLAERLREINVPFCFVSGYGVDATLSNQFPDIPFFVKPLSDQDLDQALKSISTRKGVNK